MKKRVLLEELLQSFKKELQRTGLAKGSIVHYRCQGIYPICKYYDQSGIKFYDSTINEQIISEAESKYAQGLISPYNWQNQEYSFLDRKIKKKVWRLNNLKAVFKRHFPI